MPPGPAVQLLLAGTARRLRRPRDGRRQPATTCSGSISAPGAAGRVRPSRRSSSASTPGPVDIARRPDRLAYYMGCCPHRREGHSDRVRHAGEPWTSCWQATAACPGGDASTRASSSSAASVPRPGLGCPLLNPRAGANLALGGRPPSRKLHRGPRSTAGGGRSSPAPRCVGVRQRRSGRCRHRVRCQ